MTDREMLERAAKAAGYVVEWREWVTSCLAEFGTIKHTKRSGFWLDGKQWNPLTDDGDALRLAVKLKLNVDLAYEEECVVRVFNEAHFFKESTAQDPYVATRRAIVRAAAEIGQSMS